MYTRDTRTRVRFIYLFLFFYLCLRISHCALYSPVKITYKCIFIFYAVIYRYQISERRQRNDVIQVMYVCKRHVGIVKNAIPHFIVTFIAVAVKYQKSIFIGNRLKSITIR